MTDTTRPSRPWYCYDPLADDWATVAREGGDLRMLKLAKIARSIIVNVGIIAITMYALVATNADATIVAPLGLFILGAYNGVEVIDYAAFVQGFAEVRAERAGDDPQSSDSDSN